VIAIDTAIIVGLGVIVAAVAAALISVVRKWKATSAPVLAFAWLVGLAVVEWREVDTLLGVSYAGDCPRNTKFPYVDKCPIAQWRTERWFPSTIPKPGKDKAGYVFEPPTDFEAWLPRILGMLAYSISLIFFLRRWQRRQLRSLAQTRPHP
jgi:hypothetical protein